MYIDFRKYLEMKAIQKASFQILLVSVEELQLILQKIILICFQTLRVSVKVRLFFLFLGFSGFPNTTCIG